jgi:hypothetical protein
MSPSISRASSQPVSQPVSVHLLGIRHHGPGSAASVVQALDVLQPRMVLVEAPAEATAAFQWIGHPDLVPPVALLGYAVSAPRRAVFSPFAVFSPEWQAVAWANRRGVPVRAIDIPVAITLAPSDAEDSADDSADHPGSDDRLFTAGHAPMDPIAELAAAAGEPDPERWWDDVVEHRGEGLAVFRAVAEAMAAVREGLDTSRVEAQREAHMRRAIRLAIRDLAKNPEANNPEHASGTEGGAGVIAVVCGAWHVPVLHPDFSTATADAAVLRGVAKLKAATCWVPWTHQRLAAPGYGARVRSPGWYDHVFRHAGPDLVARFVVDAAQLLRSADLAASPDHLVSVTRLADALGVLRGRPRTGLDELLDAIDAVMGGLPLVRDQLVVGHALGAVPREAPQAPLTRDLAAQQRRARLTPTDRFTRVEIDLRSASGLAKSHLLHRVAAMGLAWGVLEDGRGSTGTFRETWRLRWEPEYSVRLIELSGYGATVERAATARVVERARTAEGLGSLAALVDTALMADLPDAVGPVVAMLSTRAAEDPDLGNLMDALGPLSRVLRYGDVRSTDADGLSQMFDGLVVRILAGVVAACRSLDDGAATVMIERLSSVQAALALLDHRARAAPLHQVLERLAEAPVHGLVQGRATRLLHDSAQGPRGSVGRFHVGNRFGRAVSPGTPAATGAQFVEGFLSGSGTVLVHDEELRHVLDGWIASLSAEAFGEVIPLLRRTFGGFEVAERRQLGALLADRAGTAAAMFGPSLDPMRAAWAVRTLRLMLGVHVEPEDEIAMADK